MRLRIKFAKTAHMRYTSHLDLQRTWERTVRRAKLPLAYSQGFNPRPKINLAAALPLGFTSDCELAEIWLDHDLPENQVKENLAEAAPPGLKIEQVEAVDLRNPKLPNLIRSSVYLVTLLDPVEDLESRIEVLLAKESILRERRGKEYDLRPLVETMSAIDPGPEGEQRLRLQLAARTGATGRPDEVLAALEILPYNARVHRTELILKT